MSTRATIMIKGDDERYFLYRHCDGFPEVVVKDIKRVIERHKQLFDCAIAGHFTSQFLGMTYEDNTRVQPYEITSSVHGDESYEYIITWDSELSEYKYEYRQR